MELNPAVTGEEQSPSLDTYAVDSVVIPDYVEETQGTVDPHDILYGATPVFPNGQGYYYIWYKESMPSEVDTSVISDEYELLYQSVKLTEYKSRLNLYVTAYSICLGIVLVLMIISPFLSEPLTSWDNDEIIARENNADLFQKAEFKLSDEIVLGGMTKNSLGFTDLVHNVVYIQLPDGKFAIQESSWSSEEKAKERVNILNSLGIKSPNGEKIAAQIVKADLGDKGIRYRTMVGEFANIDEAKLTAGELKASVETKSPAETKAPAETKTPVKTKPTVKNKILSQVSIQSEVL